MNYNTEQRIIVVAAILVVVLCAITSGMSTYWAYQAGLRSKQATAPVKLEVDCRPITPIKIELKGVRVDK